MRAVKEVANAKINLFLDVISRREDGFHDIKTVMHSISLSDTVTVFYTPSSEPAVRMAVKGNRFLPTDDKNLAARAAMLYMQSAGVSATVEIKLEKRIPVAAGLAGGSSDAAATLRAMNRLFGRLFTDRALSAIAARLGSDVPYCLYGKTALCEGRGEIMTKLPDSLKLNVVVATAHEHVATPQAYSALDAMYSSFDGSIPTGADSRYGALISALNGSSQIQNGLFNVFESAVLPTYPGASALKVRMLELGASASMMSGSGPSVFGIFDSEEAARSAADKLCGEGFFASFAKSV